MLKFSGLKLSYDKPTRFGRSPLVRMKGWVQKNRLQIPYRPCAVPLANAGSSCSAKRKASEIFMGISDRLFMGAHRCAPKYLFRLK